MKLCVLGATGNSGRPLVRAALDRGHAVAAVVRDAGKMAGLAHARLTVRAVSFADHAALTDALKGHDAVVNAAGHVNDSAGYVLLIAGIVRAADAALGEGGRFWLFGGAAMLDVPGVGVTTLDLPRIPKMYEAHRANLNAVRATRLDWSMLCPGPMVPAPDGNATKGLHVSADVWPLPPPAYTRILPRIALSLAFLRLIPRMTIYYEDAADVILGHLGKNGAYSRKRVGVALPNGERRIKREAK